MVLGSLRCLACREMDAPLDPALFDEMLPEDNAGVKRLRESSPTTTASLPRAIGGATSRTLFLVEIPGSVVHRAVAAGATESAVSNEHGWRVGRIVAPFGHEWEIGAPLRA